MSGSVYEFEFKKEGRGLKRYQLRRLSSHLKAITLQPSIRYRALMSYRVVGYTAAEKCGRMFSALVKETTGSTHTLARSVNLALIHERNRGLSHPATDG